MSAQVIDAETGEILDAAPTIRDLIPPRNSISDHLPLDDVILENRHRRDLGDISDLKCSIELVGLMNPITIDSDKRLVAGERRLAACRELGWLRIPVRVLDVPDLDRARQVLIAERDENTCRKEMTLSEKVALGEAIAELERPKAADRMTLGSRDPRVEEHDGRDESARTNAIVADAVGLSRATYERAKSVVDATTDPDPEIRATAEQALVEMDETNSAKPAATKVKRARARRAPQPSESTVPGRSEAVRARREKVLAARNEGAATGAISRDLGVAMNTISDDLKALVNAGLIDPPKKGRAAVSERLERIASLAAKGWHSTRIAEELGISEQTVKNNAKRYGIELTADVLLGRTRRVDSTRVARVTVEHIEGAANDLGLIDYSRIDINEAVTQEWVTRLNSSLAALGRFRNEIKELVTHVPTEE